MRKLLIAIGCICAMLAMTSVSQAQTVTQPVKPTATQNVTVAYNGQCRWVSGFWRNGYWHPARKVCWSGNYNRGYKRGYYNKNRSNCRWVGGYWRYGNWHPRRQACW
ncbi:MAG: hypothetical protein H0W64_07360 [Gammaproteobacteria bacterium]|nr:hypothetical protein [Gammaproteobacteria bacterium]